MKCCVSLALQGLQCRPGPGRMWWNEEEAAMVPSGSLINLYPVEAVIPSEVCVCMCVHVCACVVKGKKIRRERRILLDGLLES